MQRIYLILFLIFSFISFCAEAQEDSLHHLQQVEVKAQAKVSPAQSPTPVQILNKNELENIGGESVAKAVQYFSGVQVKDYGGIDGLKTVSVRSLGANHTGVSYDGIMLNDAQNGQIDLGKFSLDNIGQISLYNGQPANILQPARAFSYASVLELKTMQPSFADSEKIKLNASFKTGSFGLVNPAATLHYKWNNKWYSSLNAEWQKANGEYPFIYKDADTIVKAIRKNSDIQAYRLQQETKYYFDSSSTFDFIVYYYNSKRGLPTAIDPKNTFTSERLWDNNFFTQATWNKKINEKNHLLIGAKYNYAYTHYLNPDYLGLDGKLENIYKQNELYFTAAYRYNMFSYLHFSVASDYFRNGLSEDNATSFPGPVRNTWLNSLSAALLLKQLEVTANVLNTNIFNSVKYGDKPSNYTKYTPAIALSYQLKKNAPLRVRAFYKNIFRVPTFSDLYYTQVGNTQLKPEFAKQYDIGINWHKYQQESWLQSYSINVDFYFNRVSDKIVAFPRQNLFQWSMLNYGKVNIKGADVNIHLLSKPIGAYNISLSGNYTYQKAQDVTNKDAANYKSQIPYTPLHSGTANFTIYSKTTSIGFNTIYSGYKYLTGQNSYATYMPSWNTEDLIFSYHIQSRQAGNWKLIVELNNIFDQQYQIVKRYPMPGRNFAITIKYSI